MTPPVGARSSSLWLGFRTQLVVLCLSNTGGLNPSEATAAGALLPAPSYTFWDLEFRFSQKEESNHTYGLRSYFLFL